MIEVHGLTKQYGKVRAVDDLSFTVRPGIITGFLGPNGAGKSTTMRMIMGLDRPTQGTALIDGVPYTSLKRPLSKIGALLDAKAVHPNRSARNHLRWIAQSNGIPNSRVDEVLSLVGLTEVAKKKAGGFSLGMGQRLGLATALLGDPEILLLDEPVNGLDPEGIHWVRELLRALAAEGRTIFVSSHLLSEMSQTADHLVVIGQGKLIADESTYDFIKHNSAATVVVRTNDNDVLEASLVQEGKVVRRQADAEGRESLLIADATTDEVGTIAFSYGVCVHELSLQRASLEQAFMEMTGHAVQYHATVAGAKEADHA
ncbi:ABC transporter ATP-binding protein [Corynebacterium sp. HS2168-gen11]|uniref:ABC transporter ATP-binding protein n=1 Tax=Corynebacterium sp. HS2168-gen11 TaxID=2974027 RepID=UPI00216AE28B|nr:ABC transporter ATP-binding protein [Corynebacterium sp. HS2168-gen11]MCS4536142.1 ABC transporter ATP-binding protein [Corynebacterium sp. HS2168-gen11]